MNDSHPVRVRFAPSPTGNLHIGSLRTAIFNWLFARHNGGTYLLRIEDTDMERSTKKFQDSIFTILEWANLLPDEPAIIQSSRLKEHTTVLNRLLAEERAYRCYCSEEDIITRFGRTTGEDFFVRYDGFCRNRQNEHGDKPFVIRLKISRDIQEIGFDDLIRGRVLFPLDQFDDFILARSNGLPMYNFVVVIDDAYMKITHVIRGEDHISNTPKQILLYQACGYAIPQFAHLPLILGPSGDRLSKRDAATSVLDYRQMGYLADALCNYLIRLGWSHGDQEIFTRDEMVTHFSLEGVGKKGSIFDLEKLAWVNSMYIKQCDEHVLFKYIQEDVYPDCRAYLSQWNEQQIIHGIVLYKERVKTLKEMADALRVLHDGPESYAVADVQKWINDVIKQNLGQLRTVIEQMDHFSAQEIQARVKIFAADLHISLTALAQPLRIALLGIASGPGIFELLSLIGKHAVLNRVARLLDAV